MYCALDLRVAISRNLIALVLLTLGFQMCVTSEATGVKRVHKDLGPLALPPSAFSASSVYKNLSEHQAHKANLNVFASQEQSSGAWCPGSPIQNQLSEWLQVTFDALKIMRIIFTEGRGRNHNAYVPAFLLRYQRQDGYRWYDYRMRNGTKLLYANHNGQTIAITLDPPIVAKRFRLYPYNELEPRFMCLRLAVYGSPFDDGVIEYVIPEGGIYRLDPRLHVALNDTSYDGSCTQPSVSNSASDPSTSSDLRRAYFHGGLGLLMDKQYYDGQLPESESAHSVVGWFRRQHTPPSDRITMTFIFDQVRNFTMLRIHTLNSLNYVALFRRVLIQFSLGGQYYDRRSVPVMQDIVRDTENREARWVSIELGYRVARFVRVTLWFDYDWIVLSEVAFDSTVVPITETVIMEKQSDRVFKLPDIEMPEFEPELLWGAIAASTVGSSMLDFGLPTEPTPHRAIDGITESVAAKESLAGASGVSTGKLRSANAPYVVAIVCCCLGSIAFASLLVYMVYRLRRLRRKRLKKLQKGQLLDGVKHPNQFILTNPHQNGGFFQPTTSGSFVTTITTTSPLMTPDGNAMTPVHSHLLQYNPLKAAAPTSFSYSNTLKELETGAIGHGLTAPLLSAHNLGTSIQHTLPDAIAVTGYKPFSTGIDQDKLLTFQLFHHGSTPGSNFSSLGGLTLARRGTSDTSAFSPYPFASVSQAGFINLAMSASKSGDNGQAALPFCPPPPPDQPLPPLPPPSNSPDSLQHPSFGDRFSGRFLIGTQMSSAAPYGASFPVHSFSTDTSLLLPLDGSMPEYASASLFSGSGSVQPSPGQPPPVGSIHSKASGTDPEVTRPRIAGETYCVPHQNSAHVPFGLWSPTMKQVSSHKPTLMNTVPQASFSTLQGASSEGLTGSLDSSGMYYLANPSDSIQLDMHNLSIKDRNLQPRTVFFPFSSATPLIPVHGMALIPELKAELNGGTRNHERNATDTVTPLQINSSFVHEHFVASVKSRSVAKPVADHTSLDASKQLVSSNVNPSNDTATMT
ncbi:unnamed protein product [Dicrocoelium dendriticum]|nr:unnamed protein product [Dicrocoelium dendriticum]